MTRKHYLLLISAFGLWGLSQPAAAAVSCNIEYTELVSDETEVSPIDIKMLKPIDDCIKKVQADNDPKGASVKSKLLEALNKAKKDCTAMKTMLTTPGRPMPTEDKGRPTWCEDPDLNKVQELLAAYNGGQSSGAGQRTSGSAGQGLSQAQGAAIAGGGAASVVAGSAAASQTSGKKPGLLNRMKSKVMSFFKR